MRILTPSARQSAHELSFNLYVYNKLALLMFYSPSLCNLHATACQLCLHKALKIVPLAASKSMRQKITNTTNQLDTKSRKLSERIQSRLRT